MRTADVEDGLKPGTTAAENNEVREAKKRIRLLERENEILRACCGASVAGEPAGKMMYPLVRELAPTRSP